MKPVGILGGMGPEATVLLMQRCLDAVDATDDCDHIPLIVHQNSQVPSRIKALVEGGGEDPAPVLASMAVDLERAGATALAMPCNTAHHYKEAIKAATALPFIDMTALTAEHLASRGARRIGMLASPAVQFASVFDNPFETNGLKACYPNDSSALLPVIRGVKAHGPLPEHVAMLREICVALMDNGCDHLLIACTELSLLHEAMPADAPWDDSLNCLVAGIKAAATSDDTCK